MANNDHAAIYTRWVIKHSTLSAYSVPAQCPMAPTGGADRLGGTIIVDRASAPPGATPVLDACPSALMSVAPAPSPRGSMMLR